MCIPGTAGFGAGMLIAGISGGISSVIIGGVVGGIASVIQGNGFYEGACQNTINNFFNGFITGAVMYCISAGINAAVNAANKGQNTNNIPQFKSKDELNSHFKKHAKEFGDLYFTADEYLSGANYVIKNGTYVPEMNGYIRFLGAEGKANYAFVGLTRDGLNITTYGARSVGQLATKLKWLQY